MMHNGSRLETNVGDVGAAICGEGDERTAYLEE